MSRRYKSEPSLGTSFTISWKQLWRCGMGNQMETGVVTRCCILLDDFLIIRRWSTARASPQLQTLDVVFNYEEGQVRGDKRKLMSRGRRGFYRGIYIDTTTPHHSWNIKPLSNLITIINPYHALSERLPYRRNVRLPSSPKHLLHLTRRQLRSGCRGPKLSHRRSLQFLDSPSTTASGFELPPH